MTYLFLWVSPDGFPVNEAFEAEDLQVAYSTCVDQSDKWISKMANHLEISLIEDPVEAIHEAGFESRWDYGVYEIFGLAKQLEIKL